ncbi:TetR family transcriptional regulator [Bailinhaonella thermotolerans]|uniref:TetR/AcrR family transcriptional regulator n=1 Tax=Bailinhaonella thermotolerans TaxID=1070861 RepID=A0A3A4A2J1_9ACTN|nr:TetR family transcriptional regulator [Bailinhaonella thermotolerans]RJL22540.1 TetR/AcrR family transcriptional regulator [Bailinhaonella thermotolerans]
MSAGAPRRLGRRPGQSETREQILAAARTLFAEKGYEGATVRGIAREAGVDPALVHHYFDTKERLFIATMRFPADPSKILPQILEGPREEVGRRILREIMRAWADPESRAPVIAMLRSAMTHERAADMMREFISSAILHRVAGSLGVPPLRVEAAASQMIGALIFRHVLRVEPLASISDEELIDLLGPVIQRYIDGP